VIRFNNKSSFDHGAGKNYGTLEKTPAGGAKIKAQPSSSSSIGFALAAAGGLPHACL
jgi:hypothetical protein